MAKIEIYDTTLRDGSQGEGISFSREDKLKILRSLDDFSIDFVEGGWPGSNPKDADFFKAAKNVRLKHSRLAAFGSTCRPGKPPAEDQNLVALLDVETPVVTIFGKSWKLHVTEVFRTTFEENLRMIEESVRYLTGQDRYVIYDAEHFFDGYRDDPAYAIETLRAALNGGARTLVLCDTNGGTLPQVLRGIVKAVREKLPGAALGIHTHNDSGVATANSLEAVDAGATHVQGTFNGLGERCGNADLANIIPSLILKMGKELSITRETLVNLTHTARYVSAIANRIFPENHPYVGQMAFAHKGGVHVNSVMKSTNTYEHITPDAVGNFRRVLISELSGKANIHHLAVAEGLDIEAHPRAAQLAVEEIKKLENEGYVFEGAEGSSTVIILKHMGKLPEFFNLVHYRVSVEHRATGGTFTEATVKIRVRGDEHLAVGEGVGPVDALDNALRKAIKQFYPEIDRIVLNDYRVRIINGAAGTNAKVSVFIESTDTKNDLSWGTVGAGENIIEASWSALNDSIIYGLWRKGQAKRPPGSESD
jgi:2-isopropylmalate synthase